MNFEKFYEKSRRANANMSLDEFIEKLKEANGSFVSDLHSKFIYRTKDDILKPYQVELIKLQAHLEKHNEKMIILMEGRDASGKGGAIRRITRYMNEKHYRVVALGKPSDVQKTQWYFQRYVEQFPKGGELVIFDRSWYNRAGVEPVMGFCTKEEYKQFLTDVPDFEKMLVESGIVVLKYYFSVSKKEQEKRFKKRKIDPLKEYKLSPIDQEAQKLWDKYTDAKYKMLMSTHTPISPWTVIKSDNKKSARLNCIRHILSTIDYSKKTKDEQITKIDRDIVINGAVEIEKMKEKRENGRDK
ncbi:MAG TPA: polyphosphate kinase 2 [Aliarcobacter cryaerophilus]|nr:polyphosphate kinase 2 [Aliarcobacter cryaerophilus]